MPKLYDHHCRPLCHIALFVSKACFLMIFILAQFSSAYAVVRYVKPGSAGTAPYTSWATASNDLQAVINACIAGDEIWIAAGTYKPNRRADALTVITATNRNNAFVLTTGVKIYGGFTGSETLLSQRNVTSNVVVLSGDIGTIGIDTDNCYHVVISSGNNNATRLDGVQVVLGNANGSAITSITVNTRTIYANRGGGVYAAASAAIFDECIIRRNNTSGNGAGVYDTLSSAINMMESVITQNIAGNNGGGIYNASSPTNITNCTISLNEAGNHGAGIFNSSSAPSVSDCDIVENEAINNGGGIYNLSSSPVLNSNNINDNYAGNDGGGIYNTASANNITMGFITGNVSGNNGGGMYNVSSSGGSVTNIKILNNTAVRGGAMYNSSSSPLVSGCALHNNIATANGGAVYNLNSNTVEFYQCTFQSNMATTSGGAIYYNGGTAPEITNSTFKGNSTNGNGGGLYIQGANVDIVNCLLSGNYAVNGGGLLVTGANPVIVNCTIVANRANSGGGGMTVSLSSTTTIGNSIIWGNTAGTGNNISGGGSLNISYSNIEGGASGIGNINANPLFTAPEPSSLAPTLSGNYRVQKCSPVINAGINSMVPGVITQDIDGNIRINYAIVDMGAYEKKLAVKAPTGIVYVDQAKAGDGSNWANALPSLADALLTARYDAAITQIWVAKGTYYPEYNATNLASLVCNTANRYNAFVLVENVKIYGGFENGAATLAERDPLNNLTILNGDINGDNTSTGNSYHVVISAGAVGNALLDGFVITGGNADYSGNSVTVNGITVTSYYGGGMGISLSSPTINDCIIQGNYGDHGGGISVLSGAPVFNRCIVRNNVAGIYGGAMDHWMIGPSSNATFNNCLITGNRSNSFGGAFVNTAPSVIRLNNTTVAGNFAATQGGGLWSNGTATEVFRNSIIWGNRVGATPSNIHVVGAGVVNATYCNIEGGYVGTGNISTDPLFMSQQPASAAPTLLGDYHLQKCSPAINVGSNASIPSGITKDLDSNNRVHLGIVDIGAYEKHLAKPDRNGIVYVDSSNAVASGDGRSWANAVTELADAMKEARDNSDIKEIWVAKGTYKPLFNAADAFQNTLCNTPSRNDAFVLPKDVKIYGGFANGESDINARNFSLHKTALSGDIGTLSVNNDNVYHVLIASGDVGTTIMDGFDINGGYARSPGTITVNGFSIGQSGGAGFMNVNATLSLLNCIFYSNQSINGGAIHNNYLTPGPQPDLNISNSLFYNNQADYGGAIYNHNNCSLAISNSKFKGNIGTFGGAIRNTNLLNIIQTEFTGNSASQTGGAISNMDSIMNISGCTFSGNKAVNEGGAIANHNISGKLLRIRNSILYNNSAAISPNIHLGPAETTINYSIIEGGFTGTGNYDLDPIFVSPQSPGSAPTTSGDYRLQACSPAINAGNNDSIPAGITKDLDSLDRIRYSTVDMGAYEMQDIDLASTTWKGVNSNWNDKINWCGGYVPYDTTNVNIPLTPNQPAIGTGYTNAVKNISLGNGTSLSVAPASSFTINGTYSNAGSSISNLGEWVMAGNEAAQSFPGALGNITDMHTLRIKNPSGISLNKSFSISGALIPEAGNIELNNDTVTLQSRSTATARIDSVRSGASFSYTGIGKFEIERFIPAKKAWRLLTAPVNAYQPINADWQEGQTNLSLVNSNTRPGYGTHISGPQNGSGFDYTNTNNPSMLLYNQAGNTMSPIPNTNVLNLNHQQGFMLFVHGSRAYDLTLNHLGTPDSTILRSRGTIKTGDQDVAIAASGFTLVGNPYASAVDFDQLQKTNVGNAFTLWDPSRTGSYGYGGYVTFTKVGPVYVAAPAPVSAGIGQYIQSGAAFFVEGSGSAGNIRFHEKSKTDNNVSTVFRSGDSAIASLRINLSRVSASTGQHIPVDGTLAVFTDWAQEASDPVDAAKKMNDNQNIGLMRGGKILSIEGRPVIQVQDTLYLSNTQLQQRVYVLEIIPSLLYRAGLQAWLIDNYLNQHIPLSLSDTGRYQFTVQPDAASAAANRFRIVFQQDMAGPVPVRFTGIHTICSNGAVKLSWTVAEEEQIESYGIEASADGRNFESIGQVTVDSLSGSSVKTYQFMHTGAAEGMSFYRVLANDVSGEKKYSNVVVADKCHLPGSISVYPNPVEESVIHLHFRQKPAGLYQVQLIDLAGKKVFSQSLTHTGGSNRYQLNPGQSLAAGKYMLTVFDTGQQQVTIPLMIQ